MAPPSAVWCAPTPENGPARGTAKKDGFPQGRPVMRPGQGRPCTRRILVGPARIMGRSSPNLMATAAHYEAHCWPAAAPLQPRHLGGGGGRYGARTLGERREEEEALSRKPLAMIRKRRGVALGWCRFGTSYRQPDRLPERQLIHPAAVPIWKGRQQAGRQTDSHNQQRPWPGTEDLLRTDNHVLVAHERWDVYMYPSVPGGRRRLCLCVHPSQGVGAHCFAAWHWQLLV